MTPFPIPVRAAAAASPDDVQFDYMPMPQQMSTFEMPRLPEPGPGHDVAGAQRVLAAFCADVGRWLEHGGEAPAIDVAALPPETLRVVDETLGEGEVAGIVGDGLRLRMQETVFAGVWREQHRGDDGALRHDWLRAAPVPALLPALAAEQAQPRLRQLPLPPAAMNVAAVVTELQDAMERCAADPAAPPHVVNLTLMPLSPEDNAHLDALLEGGAVTLLSRGFGNCRISSTAARHVWRVQYFNNMQTLILNTIEVVRIPEAALAAREDLVETRDRLAELVQWMADSVAEAA